MKLPARFSAKCRLDAEPTRAVAARHLNVFFFNAGGAPGRNDPANISYYYATIEEARYITGELAGLVVEPGANIGYVASQPTPDVFRGENAFALGVMKTNPAAKIYNKWTLARFDPNAERQAAQSLLEAPIKAGLLRILGDAGHAARLRDRGLARAREFTWRRSAEQHLAAYERALG